MIGGVRINSESTLLPDVVGDVLADRPPAKLEPDPETVPQPEPAPVIAPPIMRGLPERRIRSCRRQPQQGPPQTETPSSASSEAPALTVVGSPIADTSSSFGPSRPQRSASQVQRLAPVLRASASEASLRRHDATWQRVTPMLRAARSMQNAGIAHHTRLTQWDDLHMHLDEMRVTQESMSDEPSQSFAILRVRVLVPELRNINDSEEDAVRKAVSRKSVLRLSSSSGACAGADAEAGADGEALVGRRSSRRLSTRPAVQQLDYHAAATRVQAVQRRRSTSKRLHAPMQSSAEH